MEIGRLEGLYILVNVTAVTVTLAALADAIATRKAVYLLNGMAREMVADATVRREVFRLIVQLLLVTLAIPAVMRPGDTALSFPVVVLVAVPIVLLASSVMDTVTRRRVVRIIAEQRRKGHAHD